MEMSPAVRPRYNGDLFYYKKLNVDQIKTRLTTALEDEDLYKTGT